MIRRNTGVCPEGLPFIGLSALLALCLALLGWWFLTLVALALTGFVLNFFRDPERIGPEDPDLAVAPADGRVIRVVRAVDPLSGEQRTCVSVFMNVFNVHVNRMPVAGTVKRMRYHPGTFVNASLDKASEFNERNVIGLTDAQGLDWTMVQIAGLVARRIVAWAEPGDVLGRGERYGMIRFGSRVDLYLPQAYDSLVEPGRKVHAGETPVAARRRDDQE
jgi:phosphatidylserine decarboxylase